MKKYFFILTITLLSTFSVLAQHQKRIVEVGVFLGGSYYIGDLNPTAHFNQFTKPAAGIVCRYNFNHRLAARANLLFGNIEGHDSFSNSPAAIQRNLSFKSPIDELSAQLEFNFFEYAIGNEKKKFSPYLFLGIAGFKFNPQGELNGDWVALQPLGTEGQGLEGGATKKKYKLIQMSIPFGVGAKANLSKNIGISFEWGMRKTF
ncbi:MAG: type IX secretion system protein PorG, partial [Bacteroidia bacterium]